VTVGEGSPDNAQLIEIVSRVLKVSRSQVTWDLRQQDVETWDSLEHLNLVMELESAFEVTLQTEDVPGMDSVRGIVDALRKRGADL